MRQGTKTRLFLFILVCLAALLWLGSFYYYRSPMPSDATSGSMSARTLTTTDGQTHSIPLEAIVEGGPVPDGIPAIDEPEFESVGAADLYLKDEGLGLDVEVDGDHRFYPYQVLVWHEVVNETFDEIPLLVTYCPLCAHGAVYERVVNGEVMTFGVSGKIWENTSLLYDRKTSSLWSQPLGEAVVGELTGTVLARYPSHVATWSQWKRTYPDGDVLSRETGANRDYTRDPYGNYGETNALWFPLAFTDSRLRLKDLVYGVEVNGVYKAYPATILESQDEIEETLAGDVITLSRQEDGSVHVSNGTLSHLFWFVWSSMHPETELYLP